MTPSEQLRRRFTIYVCERSAYYPCPEAEAERAAGRIGFHSPQCTVCERKPDGYELWGENGHMQGSADSRADLLALLKHRARSEWDGFLSRSPVRPRYRRGRSVSYYAWR